MMFKPKTIVCDICGEEISPFSYMYEVTKIHAYKLKSKGRMKLRKEKAHFCRYCVDGIKDIAMDGHYTKPKTPRPYKFFRGDITPFRSGVNTDYTAFSKKEENTNDQRSSEDTEVKETE